MFNTPKPRQFQYRPRFYDPEHEKWEALKQKYAEEKAKESQKSAEETTSTDTDLEYFKNKVRQIDREEQRKPQKLGFQDLYRKRKMPTFNYTPRFSNGTNEPSEEESPKEKSINLRRASNIKIRRRFDIEDSDYLKPVSGGKIALYTLLTCLLLYWILF